MGRYAILVGNLNVRIKKFEKLTKLLVEWEDILSEPEWHDKDKIDKVTAMSVKTLGFYLGTKKNVLKLAHSICQDGDSDVTLIPWGCVRNIESLETEC